VADAAPDWYSPVAGRMNWVAMGLFEKLMGKSDRTRTVQHTSEGVSGRVNVDNSGRPVPDEALRLAVRFAKSLRVDLSGPAILGVPYGPGAGLEEDIARLRAHLGSDGALAEVEVWVFQSIANLIKAGRFTRDHGLAVMGSSPDGTMPVSSGIDSDLSHLIAGLLTQGYGFGGRGGPAVDRYGSDPSLRAPVVAWLSQMQARLDLDGSVVLPDW